MKRFTFCDRQAGGLWHVGQFIGAKRKITDRTYSEKNAIQAQKDLVKMLNEMFKAKMERMGYVKN